MKTTQILARVFQIAFLSGRFRGASTMLLFGAFSLQMAVAQRPTDIRLTLPNDIETILKTIPGADVTSVGRDGVPTFIRGNFGRVTTSGEKSRSPELRSALEQATAIFRLNPANLQVRRETTDKLGNTHVEYDQRKNGLAVVGTRLAVHIAKDGTIYAVTGNAKDGEDLPMLASVSSLMVVARLQLAEQVADPVQLSVQPRRLVYVVSTRDQTMHLAH